MAHKKGGGATAKNRDSRGKRLGVKMYGGENTSSGNIIVRQKGTQYHSGSGTMLGRDHTIFAIQEGKISFRKRYGKKIVEVM